MPSPPDMTPPAPLEEPREDPRVRAAMEAALVRNAEVYAELARLERAASTPDVDAVDRRVHTAIESFAERNDSVLRDLAKR